MSAYLSEYVKHNRACVSLSLRRLADAALAAAETYSSDGTTTYDEHAAYGLVIGRLDGVKDAANVLSACRDGVRRAEPRRRTG